MALTKTLFENKIYDGKKLWEVYMSWGKAATVSKLREWCNANGMTNPMNGRASHMGPVWAMWKYAFQNLEEAFPHWQKWAEEQLAELVTSGATADWETFLRDVAEHAKHTEVANEKDYKEFCEEHKLTLVVK